MKMRTVVIKANVVDKEGRLFTAECLREMAKQSDMIVYDEENACLLIEAEIKSHEVGFLSETEKQWKDY